MPGQQSARVLDARVALEQGLSQVAELAEEADQKAQDYRLPIADGELRGVGRVKSRAMTMAPKNPAMVPSQVLSGVMRGASLCLPSALPTK